MHTNDDAVPQQQEPIMKLAIFGKIKLIELVVENAGIGAPRRCVTSERENVLRWYRIGRILLHASCRPMFRHNFTGVVEMQSANDLPRNAPNPLTSKSLQNLSFGEGQPTRILIKLV